MALTEPFPCIRCGMNRTVDKCWPCHWLDKAVRR